MPRSLLLHHEHLVRPFMERLVQTNGAFSSGRGVGLVEFEEDRNDARLLAGAWFEKWNGVNMDIHIAALPGRRWMTREFLRYCFWYPFVQCGCTRVTGYVGASNHEARRFDEHLGFELEARLKDASPEGDVLIYVMWKEKCRWLNLKPLQPKTEH